MRFNLAFAFSRSKPVALRPEKDEASNGLEQVLAYVDSSGGEACIQPLDPSGSVIARGAFSTLVAPSKEPEGATQAIHFVHLSAFAAVERIKYLLAHDER